MMWMILVLLHMLSLWDSIMPNVQDIQNLLGQCFKLYLVLHARGRGFKFRFYRFYLFWLLCLNFFFCMTELFPIFILYFTLCEHEPVNLLSTLKGSLAELSYCTVLTNFYFCIGVHVVSFYMRYIHCCLASQGNDIYYWLLIVWSIGCLEMFGSFVEFRCYFVSRSQLKWLGNQADKGEIGEEPSDWRSDIELISSFSDPLMCEERDNFDATSFDLETEGDADLVRHGSHKRFR